MTSKFLRILIIVICSVLIFGLGINSGLKQDLCFQKILQLKKLITNNHKKEVKDSFQNFYSNDFMVAVSNSKYKYKTNKTAGVITKSGQQAVFEQEDLLSIWNDHKLYEEIKDATPYTEKNGGIKKIFMLNENLFMFSTLTNLDKQCIFGSLINVTAKFEVFRAPCLPNNESIDLNGIGGGVLYHEKGMLLAIGTPTANSQIIDDLAQDYSTPYGKILFFDRKRMERRGEVPVGEYKIITAGHRNPQGLARIRGKIYEVEQGAKGGDEINIIKTGDNYGWPLFSLGSKYNGEIHSAVGPSKYAKPLFSFQPSIGLSNLTECPSNLQFRYRGLTCILLSSLRGNSIFILLVDDKNERVISVEKIDLGMRIRDFFISDQNSQFGQSVGVTTDGYGAFNLTFNKIPITK